MRVLLLLLAVSFMSGCVAYKPVKFMADSYCDSSKAKQAVTVEEVDAGLFPHKLVLKCYAQAKPKVTITE